ncbi:MAG: hypothetical protein Q8M22_13350 [Actinomycetota bacterium]|nr:hypothetical protein [Actinomycetota bacterium]
MTNTAPRVAANVTLQVYALLFLVLGGGLGAMLGFKVGALSDGSVSDLTMLPEVEGAGKAFNWLFFEIGVAAGLIACAVLLAASFRFVSEPND